MPQCCLCNVHGCCQNCFCVKNRRLCSNCQPHRQGNCTNQMTRSQRSTATAQETRDSSTTSTRESVRADTVANERPSVDSNPQMLARSIKNPFSLPQFVPCTQPNYQWSEIVDTPAFIKATLTPVLGTSTKLFCRVKGKRSHCVQKPHPVWNPPTFLPGLQAPRHAIHHFS